MWQRTGGVCTGRGQVHVPRKLLYIQQLGCMIVHVYGQKDGRGKERDYDNTRGLSASMKGMVDINYDVRRWLIL